jgi:hypothetical protein
MTFLEPAWLLLLLPAAAAMLRAPGASRAARALRGLVYLLVPLGLAGLAVRVPGRGSTVIVVADRSASMPADAAARQLEVLAALRRAMRDGDRLGVVSFAGGAALEQAPGSAPFVGFAAELPAEASDLGAGLARAAAALPAAAPARLLVLSDGRWSGADPVDAAARLALRGVAVDYLQLVRPTAGDFGFTRVDAPAEVSPGESFLIVGWVHAPRPATVELELVREGAARDGGGEGVPPEPLVSARQSLVAGLNRVVFRDRAGGPTLRHYRLRLRPPAVDREPANDVARLMVRVRGRQPVLVVRERRDEAGLPALLRSGGIEVATAAPRELQEGLRVLAGVSAVVLEDVAAAELGSAALAALARWVHDGGGGLLVTGGRSSFGTGGYFGSELAEVLPVSMELRREHRKLRLAMVLSLDRSGSMAVPVAGGRTKMDLANLAGATVVDLLSPLDDLAVHAVDSSVHRVVPLAPLRDPDDVRQRVLRIDSAGGGIFVGAALEAAARELLGAAAGTRHVILFADAADAEEPGDYRQLLDRMRRAGITVSVVGLGTDGDVDAELLRDIARRGGGRVYFTDDPALLPRLFAQDTITVARSAFVEETTPLRVTPGVRLLGGIELPQPPPAGGYNLTYLRPGATLGMVSADDNRAPVVASWQAGLGRVAALTAQLDGPWSGPFGRWPRVGELVASLARWVAGEEGELPGGAVVTQEVVDGAVVVDLQLDPARDGDPWPAPPRLLVLRGRPGQRPETIVTPLRWSDPDSLGASIPLAGAEVAVVTLDAPGMAPRSLAPVRHPVLTETVPASPTEGRRQLERLARATGGRERLDAASIWDAFQRQARTVRLAPWLLLLAAAVLLAEVAERRLAASWRRRSRSAVAGEKRARSARAFVSSLASVARRPGGPASMSPAMPAGGGEAADPTAAPAATAPGASAGAKPASTTAAALVEARRRSRERLRR